MTKESCFILGTGSFNSLEQEPLIGLDSILGTLLPMNKIIKRMIKVSKANEKLSLYNLLFLYAPRDVHLNAPSVHVYIHREVCISIYTEKYRYTT